jgi:rSAM/selenodomain-associated transferase 1
MPRGHLVLFARAPRLGVGKRRLAAEVGDLAALRFERAMLDRLRRRLARDRRWRLRLAVTPDSARRRTRLWPPGVSIDPQGRGDLGVRMLRALGHCRPGPALLVGTDIPALAASHIAAAFRLLGRHDVVFGPAEDGGFWLVGARRPASLAGAFAGVRWSGSQALADVLSNLPRRVSVGLAAQLQDVDDGAALRRLGAGRGF